MSVTHQESPPEAPGVSGDDGKLSKEVRRLHRGLIEAMLATGSVPSGRELAERLETTEAALHAGLSALEAADYIARDASGRVICLYPFSTTPTSHVVVIDGQERFAMCSIDALGVPAMLGRELDIAGSCAVCAAPIALRIGPGTILAATPPEALVVARRDEAEPAFAACCPFTVLVCGPEHTDQFVRRVARTHTLPLTEALTHAEEIFAGLLAETLPASRPRGKSWRQDRDD